MQKITPNLYILCTCIIVVLFANDTLATNVWRLAGIGDTQALVQTGAGGKVFSDNTRWLATNATVLNIRLVTQVGDIVQNGKYGQTTTPPSSPGNQDEWDRANMAMSNLDGIVAWGTAIGNHELDWVDVIPGKTPSSTYMDPNPASPSGFEAWKQRFGPATTSRYAGMPEFGGVAPNDVDTYFIYTAGGREYLHLHLQVDIPDDTITWAQSIMDAHSELPTIISTHVFEGTAHGPPHNPYLSGSGRNSANAIWDKLIKRNWQIFMVLSGHTGQQQHQTRTNLAGLEVFTIVQDYAWMDSGPTPPGYLRLYEFDESNSVIRVKTYSPTSDTYLTDAANAFDLPLNFDLRFTVPPVVPPTLYAYDPFLMSADPSATKYDLNHPNTWYVGTIDGQSPQATGFDGTTAWGGTSHYVTEATGLTYLGDRDLMTDGGSIRYGTTSNSTRKQHRALTTAVDADLPVIYLSSLIRYDTALDNYTYTGMGIASTEIDNTDARALIWGAAGTRHGVGVKSGVGNVPGTTFGPDFESSTSNAFLYVLKVEINAGANNKEKITVFVNPNLAAGENGNIPLLDQHEAEAFSNSSDISHFVFWSWDAANSNTHYDELRLGTTWDQVTPLSPLAAKCILSIK